MHRVSSMVGVGASLLMAWNAAAQPNEAGSIAAGGSAAAGGSGPPASPVAAPAVVSAPAAPEAAAPPAAPPVAMPAPVVAGTACVLGDHPPEFPDSARTATRLVCDALRDNGVHITKDGGTAAYVVGLEQLGSTFYLRVDYESPRGTVQRTRRGSLYDLSEAEVVAPRLAKAIVTGEKMENTQNFENVAGSEARRFQKKNGEFVIGAGIAGVSAPAADTFMGPAFHLFGFYETTKWAIGLQLHTRIVDSDSRQPVGFSAFSVGGRHFFNDGEISPLVGAGLAWTYLEEYDRHTDGTVDLEGSGMSAYLEGGVEFFRLHSTRLIATLRADAPFYRIRASAPDRYSSGYYDYNGQYVSTPVVQSKANRYDVPILLNIGIGF